MQYTRFHPAFVATAAVAAVASFPGAAAAAALPGAQPAKFEVIYSFGANPSDAVYPYAGVTADGSGNLYGTTYSGGTNNAGAVFQLAPDSAETVLYSFCTQKNCADGYTPYGGLIVDANGNLYGTTSLGGSGASDGTVFKLVPDGALTVLHSFQGGSDGAVPDAALMADKKGNLFGTTVSGGANNTGTVFRLTPRGSERVLHSFAGAPGDGAQPYSSLVADKTGNLYGTTYAGGANNGGAVFRLARDGTETVLYSFDSDDGVDGISPYPGLVMDKTGNLYGTTNRGGANIYFGTVFKVAPDGTETVLHSFAGKSDGGLPYSGLVADGKGNLYGTTELGGANDQGTVFKLAPNGTETVLHTFTGTANDGAYPYDGLIADGNGNLYGTTLQGGANNKGTVFKLGK
jgi:uncharacterized repeat protein (TIGR03803 family)